MKKIFTDIWSKIYEGILNLPKLLLISCIFYLLGISSIGNLIQCKLIDTRGCLPKLKLIVDKSTPNSCSHSYLDRNYQIIDKPRDLDLTKYILVEYLVNIKNKGYQSMDHLTLRAKPLIAATGWIQSRLIGYKISSVVPLGALEYRKGEKAFKIKSELFQNSNSWFTKEHAQVNIIIAYPKQIYDESANHILAFEVECESCQMTFVKKLICKN